MDSKLQIISGKFRGRKLFLPLDARPTQNVARAAIFNMLGGITDFTEPFIVWDAFAGSGAFGIEFLSRYSNANVVFTDNSQDSVLTIKKNLADFSNGTVISADALSVVPNYGPKADIVFIDPPYSDFGLGTAFMKNLIKVLKSGAIVVWEMEKSADFDLNNTTVQVLKDKTYGRARFIILKKL